jgi:hypothetical protein
MLGRPVRYLAVKCLDLGTPAPVHGKNTPR